MKTKIVLFKHNKLHLAFSLRHNVCVQGETEEEVIQKVSDQIFLLEEDGAELLIPKIPLLTLIRMWWLILIKSYTTIDTKNIKIKYYNPDNIQIKDLL